MTRAQVLPTEFAIFPLGGALLLPHGRLPLNIFEPRYLRMVDDALASDRVIGMIQPDEARACTPSGPALYKVGCLGRIVSFSETDDERYLITLAGVSRFRVAVELELRRGYRRVRAEIDQFKTDREMPGAPLERNELLSALRSYFDAHGLDANWDAIEAMPDATLVATLSMVCPFEPSEKQALLEADVAERALTLLALLQIGAHASAATRSDPRKDDGRRPN